MADFGLTAAITLAAAAASAGGAAAAAQQQNKAKKGAQASAKRAATEQAKQVAEAAKLERLKRSREADRIRGRLAVVGAASGADPAGSYAALERQADFDEEFNLDIIQQNQRNELARVASGLDANLASLATSDQNVLLSAFGGGVQGASTGLSLSAAIPSTPDAPQRRFVGPLP